MAEGLRPVDAGVALGAAAVGAVGGVGVEVGGADFVAVGDALAPLAVWSSLRTGADVLASVVTPEDVETGAELDPAEDAVLAEVAGALAFEVNGAGLPFVVAAAPDAPAVAALVPGAGAMAFAPDPVAGATDFAAVAATAPEPTVATGADAPAGGEATEDPPHPAKIVPTAASPMPNVIPRRLNLALDPPVDNRLLLFLTAPRTDRSSRPAALLPGTTNQSRRGKEPSVDPWHSVRRARAPECTGDV